MSFEILQTNGVIQHIFITTTVYKTWKVWRVRFENETEVILYKLADEWMQRNEDNLDDYTLKAIGKCINTMILEIELQQPKQIIHYSIKPINTHLAEPELIKAIPNIHCHA